VHIAGIDGTFQSWVDGAKITLPRSPYPRAATFPRDER
jgi:hypothetical protein